MYLSTSIPKISPGAQKRFLIFISIQVELAPGRGHHFENAQLLRRICRSKKGGPVGSTRGNPSPSREKGASLSGTIGVIQARMGSERLPGKILAPLANRPMLGLIAERLSSARVDEWWLATSTDPSDDVTEAWGFELGLRVFRGHPTEVLSRFVAIGEETGADWLVRATADNPFLDAPVVDLLVDARDASEQAKQADRLTLHGGLMIENESGPTPTPALPLGYGVELVRRDALEAAHREITPHEPHHRVHVTSWLTANGRVHAVPTPLDWPDRPQWRWSVDTYEDLAMARSAFHLFGDEAATIGYADMVDHLEGHPEITCMNQQVVQKKLEEG
jgi:spore coat polysaccharide biosynthesis protein SpsF